MSLRLHNTLSGRVEEFVPLDAGKVRMYVCGVTVYDRSHIGHARALVTFDVLYRYLRFSNYDVTFVRNFTDVDDKIIARAQREGIDAGALAEANIKAFAGDVRSLRCMPPTMEPKATEHIGDMIALIQELVAKGLAYAADGDVYYAVDKFPGYGKLAKRRLEDMMAGARVDVDARKRHPMDFALWKASKEGEPAWESPWGPGRPGWHIECSAMCTRYLGQPFDIHGGGTDLIFPHHENEIAQSEGAKDCAFARYWIHNGMVTIDQEKMSKSLGNFMTVEEAVRLAGGEAVRMFVIGTHYRSPLDFSADRLEETRRALARIYETLARVDDAIAERDATAIEPHAGVVEEFKAAMDDDLNTARAIGVLFETVRTMNRLLDEDNLEAVLPLRRAVDTAADVLGIGVEDPRAFLESAKHVHLEEAAIDAAEIERLIGERAAARKAKDFQRADAIRNELKDKGIVLEDKAGGTVWKVER
jgi:cysteinyl-tRNA synthetase